MIEKEHKKSSSITVCNYFNTNFKNVVTWFRQLTTPSWISVISWWIGGLLGGIWSLMILITHPNEYDILLIYGGLGGILCFFSGKLISYVILFAIYYGIKLIQKGSAIIAQKGPQMLNNIAVAVTKKTYSILEQGKTQAKLDQEKNMLENRAKELEIKLLQQHIKDLEKQLPKD